MDIFPKHKFTRQEVTYSSLFFISLIIAGWFYNQFYRISVDFANSYMVAGSLAFFFYPLIFRKLAFPTFYLFKYKYRGFHAQFLSFLILIMLLVVFYVNNILLNIHFSFLSILIGVVYGYIVYWITLKATENYE